MFILFLTHESSQHLLHVPTVCQTALCPEELTTWEWTLYFCNSVSVDPLYIVKTIPLLKPIRDFNPPDDYDWLEMDTGLKAGQSGSRRLMSQNFPLASGKRSLFLFFTGVLRLFKLDSSGGTTYKSQRARETYEWSSP